MDIVNPKTKAAWQKDLLESVDVLQGEAFSQHQALTRIIQALPRPTGQEAVNSVARAMQIARGLTEEEAEAQAKNFLKPGDSNFSGLKETCPLMWRYDDESLWRGMSDNKKLLRFIRSMILNGFLCDEPLDWSSRAGDGADCEVW